MTVQNDLSSNLTVRVEYTAAKGRHVIANQLIRPGEVIAKDDAIISFLTPDKYNRDGNFKLRNFLL